MSRMLRSFALIGLFVVLFLAPFVVRFLGHYRLFGGEDRPELPVYEPAEVVPVVATPAANLFEDEPNGEGNGYVLLDIAHSNFIEDKDINYLDSRLSLRGYQLLRYASGELATALRGVSAFVVIAPTIRYEADEIAAVRDFVGRGGRLLLVGDPTRFNVIYTEDLFSFSYTIENDDIALNSLGNEFDINFTGDYLYNTVENEGNFRNILIDSEHMGEHDLTADLEQLAFYGAHSLTVGRGGRVLLMGDDNTATSSTDRPGGLALAVLSADGNVLALGDVDFLSAPYYTSLDNSAFVARIADFLVDTDTRSFVVEDFPFFYDGAVDLVYAGSPDLGPDAFDEIILLQDAFEAVNIDLTLAAAAADNHDALYLGLYNQATDVAQILSDAGITLTIDPAIATSDSADEATPTPTPATSADEDDKTTRQIQSAFGNVQMSGTALILLGEKGNQQQVVVLAASLEGLENTVDRLLSLTPRNGDDALADCLVQDNLALCPSGVTDEEVEAELDTGGVSEPIVIDDGGDDSSTGELDELEAIRQGSIGLNETVDGNLGEGESHSWVFNEGPAVIDITLQGDDLDGVMELYDSNYDLLESMDSTFTGDEEILFAVDIPDDDDYYIVVRDYFGDPADYTLSIEESSGEPGGGSDEASIFIFVDDDGTPAADGLTSGELIADYLGLDYAVTLWTTTIDGPLSEDVLQGYNVIFWDSGDYRTEDVALDEDSVTLLEYAFNNGAAIIAFGSTPPLVDLSVETAELVPLSDIEVIDTEPLLTDGLAVGDVFTLDQTYDVINISSDDLDDETDMVIFAGGPDSPDVGTVSVAVQEDFTLFFLTAPFSALPADLQFTLLFNIMAWLGY